MGESLNRSIGLGQVDRGLAMLSVNEIDGGYAKSCGINKQAANVYPQAFNHLTIRRLPQREFEL